MARKSKSIFTTCHRKEKWRGNLFYYYKITMNNLEKEGYLTGDISDDIKIEETILEILSELEQAIKAFSLQWINFLDHRTGLEPADLEYKEANKKLMEYKNFYIDLIKEKKNNNEDFKKEEGIWFIKQAELIFLWWEKMALYNA